MTESIAVPEWLSLLASASLILAGLCSLAILIDILSGRRQHMWIMNIVWPVTALYSGPIGLWLYFKTGRHSGHHHGKKTPSEQERPYWQSVALAATHCGSGCTLGDIMVEGALFFVPLTLFGREIFASWAVDFVAAFLLGIVFQYFTIVPMRHLSFRQGIAAAFKADALSLTAWQIGMYGWMAIATFAIFGHELGKNSPVFWWMMQIAMLAGFSTSFPVNWWLIKAGIKEKM